MKGFSAAILGASVCFCWNSRHSYSLILMPWSKNFPTSCIATTTTTFSQNDIEKDGNIPFIREKEYDEHASRISTCKTNSRRIFLSSSLVALIGSIELGDVGTDEGFLNLHPSSAFAYDRDVGADGFRSADTAAMNIQAKKTNARLEAEGFKLDTREEEEARLSSAMASFSYDSANNNMRTKSFAGKRSFSPSKGGGASSSSQK